MTISVDEVISGAYDLGTGTSFPFTKSGATSPTALLLQFIPLAASTDIPPTSVTYNGVAISLSSYTFVSGASTIKGYYGSLLPPASGVHDIVLNFSGGDFKILYLLATFWTGDVTGINWTTQAASTADPVINIAKAASSALSGFVFKEGTATLSFTGDGTNRVIEPGAALVYAATQEPAQGAGVMNWTEHTGEGDFNARTAYVCAEILGAAAAVPVGNPLTTIRARARSFSAPAKSRVTSGGAIDRDLTALATTRPFTVRPKTP